MIFKLIYGNHAADGLAIYDTLHLLKHSLEELGHEAHFERNMCPGHINILTEFFTYDFLEHYKKVLKTPGTQFIIIATEYLTGSTFNNFDNLNIDEFTPLDSHYDNLSYWKKRFSTFSIAAEHAIAVWHLSEHQVTPYQSQFGSDKVGYFPHAFVESLCRKPFTGTETKDIDVIFTGTATPYRGGILSALSNAGLKVKVLPVMTPDYVRDSWVGRSKVAINLRQHADWKYPSNSRYYYHLINRSFLVSELCEFDCDLSRYVIEKNSNEFVDYIVERCEKNDYQAIVDENLALFKVERPLMPILKELLDKAL